MMPFWKKSTQFGQLIDGKFIGCSNGPPALLGLGMAGTNG
jgi:hypothetical protein